MAVVAAPKPRSALASRLLDAPCPPALLPAGEFRIDPPTITIPSPHTPSQLLSPIQLSSSPRVALSIQRSASPCSPTLRRRRVAHAHRAPRPRRQHARADCFLVSAADRFDLLPWISLLDATPLPPDESGAILDLSHLDISVTSAGGPVRRRKTSLRSSPMAKPSELDGGSFTPASIDARPRTPAPVVLDPSLVVFHNLMPVLPCDAA